MYQKYFGLHEPPFSIAVNPRYLFMSPRHRDALAHLIYGVGVGGGFILLSGEVGTGKTTITRCLLEQLPEQTDIALILNPALNAVELLAAVCDELHIGYHSGDQSLKGLSDKLHRYLLANHQRGRNTVLLIDEAQHLQFEVLEQIRLLTNLETNTQKLLQIILVGQPELVVMLARPELRQLSQRITARYQLKPFTLEETDGYIRHRLHVAGLHANQELFPPRVVKHIYQVSKGIPRLINVLCDRILLGTYGQNKAKVDMAMARQAVAEVKGEDDELARPGRKLGWPVAVACLVLAAVAALLWLQWSAKDNPPQSESETLASPEVDQIPPGDVPVAVSAAEIEPEQPLQLFFDTQKAALNRLLLATGVVDAPLTNPCEQLAGKGWRCETLVLQSWSELQGFNTPVVLELRTRGRVKAWAALVAIAGNEATVVTANGEHRLSLSELGEWWTGVFILPWYAPSGYTGPLRWDDRGDAVAWLSQQFARLDGQPEGLAGKHFTRLLQQRVMLFQREQSLVVDGVAGLKTMLQLNRQLGDGSALLVGPVAAYVKNKAENRVETPVDTQIQTTGEH